MSGERVGFLGLGTMGAAMAANLARAGFAVTAWNRSPGRAPDLDALGVERAPTPADVARAAEVIVICVSDTPDVDAVLFGPDGVAGGAHAGQLVIDCSTISPSATRDFGARLAASGVDLVDAPVSGGSEGAQKATLTIFCGGRAGAVERARPILAAMGRTITHVGPSGSGQAVKAVNQVSLAGTYLGVAVVWLPPHPMNVALSLMSLAFILGGVAFSVYSLAHLGRSFSLMLLGALFLGGGWLLEKTRRRLVQHIGEAA